jgi:hypothetical protein
MTVNEKTISVVSEAVKLLKKIPTGTYFCFNYKGGLNLEGRTQEDVKKIRKSFRGVIWSKRFVEYAETWEYKATTRSGVEIMITGVTEGPPACKMVEEIVMEERSEPIGYTKKMVEVKRVRYICPEGDKS